MTQNLGTNQYIVDILQGLPYNTISKVCANQTVFVEPRVKPKLGERAFAFTEPHAWRTR